MDEPSALAVRRGSLPSLCSKPRMRETAERAARYTSEPGRAGPHHDSCAIRLVVQREDPRVHWRDVQWSGSCGGEGRPARASGRDTDLGG